MGKICLSVLVVFLVLGCKTEDKSGDSAPTCTFTNPIAVGADPWIILQDDVYYAVESHNGGIKVFSSADPTTIFDESAEQIQVWEQPEEGWNRTNLWAPELHYIQGEWYIYYTAGEDGPPFIHQRSGVLRATTDSPLGPFEDKGILYTGDDIDAKEDNIWSIDLTVLEYDNKLYGIWSGWEQNAETDRTPQHLYIAEMENPWTISSNRVQISSPEQPWETGSELAINEGPEILKNENGDVFVIYSASESWLPAYNLGQLRLKSGADPMDPSNWEKSGSVFSGSGNVIGTGHASFMTSPDDTEDWIVYHTKVDSTPGWDRRVHMQPFSWNEDGSPEFGKPVQPGEEVQKPSGVCPE